jgi:hypothetical protein
VTCCIFFFFFADGPHVGYRGLARWQAWHARKPAAALSVPLRGRRLVV